MSEAQFGAWSGKRRDLTIRTERRSKAMNDILRERLIRKLDTLPEEKIYQILDYIDFLESK